MLNVFSQRFANRRGVVPKDGANKRVIFQFSKFIFQQASFGQNANFVDLFKHFFKFLRKNINIHKQTL
jgi:hypothetical protein